MKNNKGFTLLELIIVITIIGGISAFILIRLPSGAKRARDTTRMKNVKNYQLALENYALKNAGLYPINETPVDITTLCTSLNITSGECPTDPKGGIYLFETNASGTSYTITSTLEYVVKNFIVCSNGKSGKTSSSPVDGLCPTFDVENS